MSRDGNQLGQELRRLKTRKGLSYKEILDRFSKQSARSPHQLQPYRDSSSLSRIMNGGRIPSRSDLLQVLIWGLEMTDLEGINKILKLAEYEVLSKKETGSLFDRTSTSTVNPPESGALDLDLTWPSTRPAGLSCVARVGFSTNAVQAFDHANNRMWTYTFSSMIDPYALERPKLLTDLVRFADFGMTGKQDIVAVVPLRTSPNPSQIALMTVVCFSEDGRLLWSCVPEATFRFGKRRVVGPWIIWDIFISGGANPMIWVAVGHTIDGAILLWLNLIHPPANRQFVL